MIKQIAYLMLALVFLAGCNNAKVKKTDNKPAAQADTQAAAPDASMHKVVAKDVLQTSGYSYLLVTEGDKEYWVAVSRFEAEKGKTYYFNNSMEMNNFKSKELNRTFDSILFIQEFSDQPIQPKQPVKLSTKGRQNLEKVDGIKVDPAGGSTSVAGIFKGKSGLAGKTVKVRGQVVKFSPEIMNKNWVHLQDGTEEGGSFDLVITTTETVQVGQVVTFEGTLAVDKDFGYGYKYDVLLEDAKTLKQN